MDLLEYQGKQFFAKYGIPVSPGEAVETVDDAVAAADRIGYPVVVKAQLGNLSLGNVYRSLQVITHEEVCF